MARRRVQFDHPPAPPPGRPFGRLLLTFLAVYWPPLGSPPGHLLAAAWLSLGRILAASWSPLVCVGVMGVARYVVCLVVCCVGVLCVPSVGCVGVLCVWCVRSVGCAVRAVRCGLCGVRAVGWVCGCVVRAVCCACSMCGVYCLL